MNTKVAQSKTKLQEAASFPNAEGTKARLQNI